VGHEGEFKTLWPIFILKAALLSCHNLFLNNLVVFMMYFKDKSVFLRLRIVYRIFYRNMRLYSKIRWKTVL